MTYFQVLRGKPNNEKCGKENGQTPTTKCRSINPYFFPHEATCLQQKSSQRRTNHPCIFQRWALWEVSVSQPKHWWTQFNPIRIRETKPSEFSWSKTCLLIYMLNYLPYSVVALPNCGSPLSSSEKTCPSKYLNVKIDIKVLKT